VCVGAHVVHINSSSLSVPPIRKVGLYTVQDSMPIGGLFLQFPSYSFGWKTAIMPSCPWMTQ
jgi:hypothetical protein